MSRGKTVASRSSDKTAVQNSSRDQLEKQIADFLKGGGKIQQIPNGMSAGISPVGRQKPHAMAGNPPPKRQ